MTKKFVSMFLTLVMCLTLSAPAWAVVEKTMTLDVGQQNCITFEEYLKKYGEAAVKEGFDVAEAEAMGTDYAMQIQGLSDNDEQTIPYGKSLFECLSEGEFLGHKVLGVSDVTPGSDDFMICIDDGGAMLHNSATPSEVANSAMRSGSMPVYYPNYAVYYTDNAPDSNALENLSYEPKAGSYLYKYSYAFEGNYQCDTTVTFNNTTLGCGSQNNNMYLFLAAISSTTSIDFGFMANPSASSRNQGLYVFYFPRDTKVMWVEDFPKVKATSYNLSSKTMTLENKTVTIKLSVGTDKVNMYMESGGSMIFYTEYKIQGLVAGNPSKALTFLQAMSCVEQNENFTSITSGSYFRNVKFSNTVVYNSANGCRDFKTMGSATYYTFLCKPDGISYEFNDNLNTQTVSIDYKK